MPPAAAVAAPWAVAAAAPLAAPAAILTSMQPIFWFLQPHWLQKNGPKKGPMDPSVGKNKNSYAFSHDSPLVDRNKYDKAYLQRKEIPMI